MRREHVQRVGAKLLLPYILLFALYTQWHGELGPGGGFQAGVMFAAGVILYTLVFGITHVQRAFPPLLIRVMIAVGVLIYGGTGLLPIFLGHKLFDYTALGSDPVHAQELGVTLVEIGVGITVSAVMIQLFLSFASRRASP